MPKGTIFSRRRVFWKYTFYITMSILAVVNSTFLICNWQSLTLGLNNESLLLSVVGFFFAFAGINIYSIFNTNIESEKAALRALQEKYDGELRLSAQMLRFPQELIMIWHIAQYISTAKVIQSKSFDWLRDLKKRMKSQRDFVQGLRDNYQIEIHERYRDDLANLAQGVLMVMSQHLERINISNEFFVPIVNNKDTYITNLEDVIQFIEETVTYEYEPELPQVELSTWDKTKKVFQYALKTFKRK